jgi:hypothetical protein
MALPTSERVETRWAKLFARQECRNQTDLLNSPKLCSTFAVLKQGLPSFMLLSNFGAVYLTQGGTAAFQKFAAISAFQQQVASSPGLDSKSGSQYSKVPKSANNESFDATFKKRT